MDSSWPRVKALFQAALEWPIEDRHGFLVAEAGDDEVLRREVESLLTSDALEGDFLDRLPTAHGSVLDDSLAAQLASADHAASRAVLTQVSALAPMRSWRRSVRALWERCIALAIRNSIAMSP